MAVSKNAMRVREYRGTKPRPCVVCGEQFDRDDLRVKACSEQCRTVSHRRSIRRNLGIAPPGPCIECGTQVPGDDSRLRLCSEECRLARQRRAKRLKSASRRATKLAQMGEPFTQEHLDMWLDFIGRACVYCGGPFEEIDHCVPLARGGLHELVNLRPSCSPCNRSKRDRLLDEWPGCGR